MAVAGAFFGYLMVEIFTMVRQMCILTGLLITFLLLSMLSCVMPEGSNAWTDSDGDGWSNAQEDTAGTDPQKVDTDDDGYWDPHDPNPLDASIPANDGLPKPPASPGTIEAPPATPPSESPVIVPARVALQEFHQVQDAVKVMMRNNSLTKLPNPASVPTNDMHRFPDFTTRHGSVGVGYVLFCHDFNGDGKPDANYIHCNKTRGTYICDEYGKVTQVTTGYE